MNNEIKTESAPAKKTPKKPEAEILLDRQLEMKDKTKLSNIITIALFCLFILFFGIMFIIMPDNNWSQTEKRQLASAPDFSPAHIKLSLDRDLKLMTMTEDQKTAYTDESNWSNVKAEIDSKIDKMKLSDDEKAELKVSITHDSYFLSFADEISKYYQEQFPFRDELRVIKGFSELLMLKRENHDVLFAKGYLVKKDTLEDKNTTEDAEKTVKLNVQTIGLMESVLPENVTCVTAVAGRTVDIAVSALPKIFPYASTNAERYWQTYTDAAAKYNVSTVELKDTLKAEFDAGEYVYYKTDHHWTTLGAYYAYRSIIEAFGKTPRPIESFTRETFTTDFLGTTYATAGVAPGGADTIEFFRYEGDTDYETVIINDTYNMTAETTLEAFYNYKYRDTGDKYSAFLGSDNQSNGGNNALTLITKKTSEPREKMIVFKDSFGHSLVPFLAIDYDLVVIDPRYFNGDLSAFLSDGSVTAILFIYNMATFSNGTGPNYASASAFAYYQSISN